MWQVPVALVRTVQPKSLPSFVRPLRSFTQVKKVSKASSGELILELCVEVG
jgi:hypothetical protein